MNPLQTKIDRAIKNAWMNMEKEYNNGWLRRKSSIVSSFYYNLRKKLKDSFFIDNNFRIYTEYHFANVRADLVIVKLNKNLDEIKKF